MSARTAIENVLYQYAWAFDTNDMDMFADCFTVDATVKSGDMLIEGRDTIRATFSERRAARALAQEMIRHLTTNVSILEETDDQALVRSYYALVVFGASELRLGALGWYEDRIVNDGGTWRIKSRVSVSEARI